MLVAPAGMLRRALRPGLELMDMDMLELEPSALRDVEAFVCTYLFLRLAVPILIVDVFLYKLYFCMVFWGTARPLETTAVEVKRVCSMFLNIFIVCNLWFRINQL